MTPSRWPVTLTLAAVLVPAALAAQQVFRASTDLVLLSVAVTDTKGRPVGGLTRERFQVFEDGLPQDVTVFSRDPQPVALSLLLDSSTSMEPRMAIAQQAASGFVARLGPGDVAQVIDFDTRAIIAQPFTNNIELLDKAIRKTEAGGRTALYDAVYIALTELTHAPKLTAEPVRRQTIVLLSDGEDTASHTDYESVMDLSHRSDVIVYCIGLRAKDDEPTRPWNEAEFVLRTLAQETGGRVFFVTDPAQLPSVYGQIADELTAQYTLGYRSRNQKRDGQWRRVAVQIAEGAGAAHTKAGYYGPAKER